MRRISGGAVWSNRPCTDLARASVEQLAGATLRIETVTPDYPVFIIAKICAAFDKCLVEDFISILYRQSLHTIILNSQHGLLDMLDRIVNIITT